MMDLDYNGSRMELDERLSDVEVENSGKQDSRDKEKPRESSKHRSKEKKKGRHGEREHGSKDRERSKERGRENFDDRDSGRHGSREMDRLESRERRKEERDCEKDQDRDKEKSRSRAKETDYGREKHRDKDREHDWDRELGRERSYDREHQRGIDRDKERGKEREEGKLIERERDLDRSYDRGRERDKLHEHDRGREREKLHEHMRHRDKEREWDRDGDRGHDRSKVRDRDHEKGLEREKGKDKDYDRVKEREKGKEKDRDRVKDKEREREKSKDREKAKEKEKDRERDRSEREKDNERRRDKEVDQDLETDQHRDKSRVRDREKETARSKEGEKDEKVKVDGGEEDLDRKSAGFLEPSSELEERIKKMKDERFKRKSDAGSEISSWVNKSRQSREKKNTEEQKALRLSKALEEQDNILAENEDEEAVGHSGKDLAGIKILHGLDKVIEGGAVVLTLKDQNILADGDINEDIDVLENVEIGEQKQRDEAYRAAKKKPGVYDDKFSDDMGSRKTILPQYDDPIEDEGVTLDESGRFTGEAEKKLEELRRRIEGGSSNRSYVDLISSGKISSDYYTHDEMLQFNKPKKKKSLRKKEKLDLDALEVEAISAGLGAGDLGSRKDMKRQFAKEEREKAEADLRSGAYQAAYAKAEKASKFLRQDQTLTVKVVEDDDLVFGEDYDDLQKSLEQARKLAIKSLDEAAASGPQAVALLASAKRDQGDNQEPTGGDPEENKVVITEMEEFVLGLQLNEDSHNSEGEEDVFMDEEGAARSPEQETEDAAGGWMKVKEPNKVEQLVNEDKEVEPVEIIHESSVGKGLAGALKLLKDRGTLKESIDWGGRNMDKKKSKLVGIHDDEGTKEIRIERTDEFGRIMTPKEAFRVISHKFHGKGPGKMKQEKRMKQYQEDLKTKQMKASDTPLLAMERMKEAQARLKTPYLVLSGHVKPGQTSDPNSGFATVEKDHLGSLTPMLGDKKVEHFLGIKRKDGGSMGPPPPKKPKS